MLKIFTQLVIIATTAECCSKAIFHAGDTTLKPLVKKLMTDIFEADQMSDFQAPDELYEFCDKRR
jgi:hypothetical protein